MTTADRYVSIVAADLDLSSFADRLAARVEAQYHGRLSSAVTDGFDFGQIIAPRQQPAGALKKFALKIGAQSITQYWNIEYIRYIGELSHLGLGEELRFVNQHATDRHDLVLMLNAREQIVRCGKGNGRCIQSNP